MAVVEFKVKGLEETLRRMKQLPVKVAKKVIRQSLRDGAKKVLPAVQALAPVKSGTLKKSLKVRARLGRKRGRTKPGRVQIQVGMQAGDYKGESFYGSFQELGWKTGSRKLGDQRKQNPGLHFTEKGFEQTKDSALSAIVEGMKAGIEREASSA